MGTRGYQTKFQDRRKVLRELWPVNISKNLSTILSPKSRTVDFWPLFGLFCPRNSFVLDMDKILQLQAVNILFCFPAPEFTKINQKLTF